MGSPLTRGEKNSRQDKKLTKGEIKKLKTSGINPEKVKGNKKTGKKDLYKDKKGYNTPQNSYQ
jgi:hypothetical protein